ncbi:monosaccharide-p-dolichol utilization protein [Thamnocephalis sphaerospora]|uniref:Mannose-P-dolichol utilization defect 1 protein homolog n=1 Tax=Thamnocephalis sphaerospora TaxID=78915 RepID=A0A4P9XPG4_9FUNG|nr:monosaccharide-p-dolichol utilization protein [Thamnocephalis sphaerospora]|eukprot:RKP07878.1 monosaccharide-p-dolichol utilization protein [Thamnocephalis sphaerospora]
MDLPPVLRSPVVALIGTKCYEELLLNLNFANVDCLRLVVSKGLGIGLVAGGALLKLPQIAKIVQARSAKGLSLSSLLIETAAFCIMLAYNMRQNNPFSTYGESVFIFGQNLIIIALMYALGSKLPRGLATVAVCLAFFWVLLQPGFVSDALLAVLQAATIPMFLGSKVPQMVSNYQSGSTGQLAAFTVFSGFLGAAARVLTTLQEVDDKIILLSYILSTVFNGVIAAQMVYYWNASTKSKPKSKSKVKGGKKKAH